MNLEVLFVGTGGSAPTARRGLPAMLVRRGGEDVLVDCGEGTQRQLMRSSGLVELDLVLLTHLHADHWLGLPGLLKTFDLREREAPLLIAGPVGTTAAVEGLLRITGGVRYPLTVQDVEPGDELRRDGWTAEAIGVQHRTTALGWVVAEDDRPGRFDVDAARALGVGLDDPREFGLLQRGETVRGIRPEQVTGEKRFGRRIVFSGDTRPCDAVRKAAWRCDLLVHEATFLTEHEARARKTGHSTAAQAAALAEEAEVGLLALTHLSARHRPSDALAEARAAFEHTVLPRDFDVVEVPFPERGDPVLHPGAGRAPRGGVARPDVGPALDDPEDDAAEDGATVGVPDAVPAGAGSAPDADAPASDAARSDHPGDDPGPADDAASLPSAR
ncbi:ribonuclease Z [Patulibacter minatonensis]|uniref:ribonuclease Z n=1 Tax=Patulibacter minatonensis TaxID=298163 RepID=UPI0004B9E1A6|nr:ribonuclease Z [Patulibacter minatonensis]